METFNPKTSEKMAQVRLRIENHLYSLGLEGDIAKAIVDFAMDLSYDAWKRGRAFGMRKASGDNSGGSYRLATNPA